MSLEASKIPSSSRERLKEDSDAIRSAWWLVVIGVLIVAVSNWLNLGWFPQERDQIEIFVFLFLNVLWATSKYQVRKTFLEELHDERIK